MAVLIVGAGPSGLTLGLALRRYGIACRVIDKLPARLPWSRALAVQARTLEVMQRFGLAVQFLSAGQHITGVTIHMAAGPVQIDLPKVHPIFPPAIILPQQDTERILEDAFASVDRGVEFVGLDGATARLRHTDGHEESIAADWIVGCDGAHSAVRTAVHSGFSGRQYAEHWLLADCSVTGLAARRIHAFPGAPRTGVFFPLPNGSWRGVAALSPDEPDPPDQSMEPFARDGLVISDPTWWSRFRVSRRQVDQVRHGQVVLLGDAAHIHSPVGGQGMNLGIQDAFALADAIARPADARSDAVDAWAAQRHRVARRVLLATDLATRAATGKGEMVRRLGLGAMSHSAWLRERAAGAMAGLNYPEIPA